jgi:hypothetical protein
MRTVRLAWPTSADRERGTVRQLLISLKDAARRRNDIAQMYQTYELYVREKPQDEPSFEPLTCQTAVQVMEKARNLLEHDSAIASIEVRLAGQHLFTLER